MGNGDQLQAAFATALASSRSKTVIIERQVEGHCHRLFIAQGRLLYAVKRLPMSVRADRVTDVAGIDIISTDIARPWFETGAIINEVNFAPLLGGAEISRSHLPKHLAHFIHGDGTIPVEVFAGADAAWMAASDRWQHLVSSGVDAVLIHGQLTLEPSGQAWHMAVDGRYKRTRALVMSRRVQALVLVVQTDELLGTGLPLEAVSQVTVVDQGLLPLRSAGGELAAERIQAALRQLMSWQRLPAASKQTAAAPSFSLPLSPAQGQR